MASKGVDEYFPKFTWHFLIWTSFRKPTPIQFLPLDLAAIWGSWKKVNTIHFPGKARMTLDFCVLKLFIRVLIKCSDSYFPRFPLSALLSCVPSYISAKQQVKLLLCVLPTVEQSAKCHLSTCALMINTILMVSINFLLHQQKAAVALSLSWPCACFGKPLCGSCWMEIVRFS